MYMMKTKAYLRLLWVSVPLFIFIRKKVKMWALKRL